MPIDEPWLDASSADVTATDPENPKPKPKPTAVQLQEPWLTGNPPPQSSVSEPWLTKDPTLPTPPVIDTAVSDASGTTLGGAVSDLNAPTGAIAPDTGGLFGPDLLAQKAATDARNSQAMQGLQQLLDRPDITPAQRQRVTKLLHQQRLGVAQDQTETPDNLAAFGAKTLAGSLAEPIGAAQTFLTGKQTITHNIQVGSGTVDPKHPLLYASVAAGATVLGTVPPSQAEFELSKALLTTAAPKFLVDAASEQMGRAGNVLAGLATKYGASEATSAILANTLKKVPLNFASGIVMQMMSDPKSLRSPAGLAMAGTFGALGSIGDGKQMYELESASIKANQAAEVAQASADGQTRLDPAVAKALADAAEKNAVKQSRLAAAKAWNALTPDLRKAIHPEATDQEVVSSWKDLDKGTRDALAGKIRQGVAQAAAASPDTKPSPEPTPDTPTVEIATSAPAPTTLTNGQPEGVTSELPSTPPAPGGEAAPQSKPTEGKVVGSIGPSDATLAQKLADAIKLKPEEIDQHISELENQLAQANLRVQDADRRAKTSAREARTDPLTGFQNARAWEEAKGSIEANPNTHIVMYDLKNVHPDNEVSGKESVDERIRDFAAKAQAVHGKSARYFRLGGDEFAVVSSEPNLEAQARTVENLVDNSTIKGTNYPRGVRFGIGTTLEEADKGQRAAKQAAPAAERARPVEVASAPPDQSSPEGTSDYIHPDLIEPKLLNNNADLEDQIDIADKLHEDEEITTEQYRQAIDNITAQRKIVKGKASVGSSTSLTRDQQDRAAVRGMTEGQLRETQDALRLDAEKAHTSVQRAQLNHDLEVVRRELRWRKPVEQLTDQSLDKHANELNAEWQDTPAGQRAQIEARMGQVEAEYKRRAKPSFIRMITKDERGSITFDRDPLESDIPPNSPEYMKRVLRRVNSNLDRKNVYEGLDGHWSRLDKTYADDFRWTHVFDTLDKLVGNDPGNPIQSMGGMAEILPRSAGRAQEMLRTGTYSINEDGSITRHDNNGLEGVLNKLKGRLPELRAYLTSVATLNRIKQGKVTGVSPYDATRVIQNAKPDIVAAGQEFVKVMNGFMQYATDAGVYSQELAEKLMAIEDAGIPLNRVFEGVPENKATTRVGVGTGKKSSRVGAKSDLKESIGSQRQIVDPLISAVDRGRRRVRIADLNRLSGLVVDAAESNPELFKRLVWRDTARRIVLDANDQAVIDGLKSAATEAGVPLTDEQARTIALTSSDKNLRGRTDKLVYIRNGKPEVWNIAPEIAAAYRSMSPEELAPWMKALAAPTALAKKGIVDNPLFASMIAIIDSFDAATQSKYGFKLGISSIEGFLHILLHDKTYHEYRRIIGSGSSQAGADIQSLSGAVKDLLPTTASQKVVDILNPRNLFHNLRQMSVPFMESAKVGEFAAARGAGAQEFRAGLASTRAVANFQMEGAKLQALHRILLFSRPALQYLDRVRWTIQHNPGRASVVGLIGITLPSAYLWAVNHDDQDINELRKSADGDQYWYWRGNPSEGNPDGQIYKIKKPYVLGAIFGTTAEDALDKLYDSDPTAGRRLVSALLDQGSINIIPTAANLTYGLWSNTDIRTGQPIAPNADGSSAVLPEFQARPSTGPTSRQLGALLGVSPAKIDFAVRNATGTLGKDAWSAIDMVNDAKNNYPVPPKADLPLVGRFIARFPSMSAFSIQEFYRNADRVDQIGNSLKKLEVESPDKIPQFVKDHQADISTIELYAEQRLKMRKITSMNQQIAVLPAAAMSPELKRKIIDNNTRLLIQSARDFNKVMQQVPKQ